MCLHKTGLSVLVVLLGLFMVNTATAELVAHWAFDGDATDSTGNGHDGVEQNGPVYVAGQFKQAIEVDGSSSHVTVPHSDDLSFGPSDAYSVVAWIYPTRLPGNWAGVVTKGRDSGDWYGIWINGGNNWVFGHDGNNHIGSGVVADTWTHVALTYDNGEKKIYLNGELDNETTSSMNATGAGDIAIGAALGVTEFFPGWIDEVGIFNHSLTPEEVLEAMLLSATDDKLAGDPLPEDAATDVPRDSVVAWTPGQFAVKHDVHFGTVWADVNDAQALVSQGQNANTFDPGRLAFGQTYFWRVDEVNGAPDNTVFKGSVWEFTVEPFSFPIANVTATASSAHGANTGPEKTIDGSGLNAQDQHSTLATDMWLSTAGASPWIQYEFDKTYKLHEMWVWNQNQLVEAFIGFGAKDVTVETSVDGTEWSVLEDATQFAQATGAEDYTANTIVDFNGAVAKLVRITINAGWGIMPQNGLSEVRFFYIPVEAREPKPAHGATTEGADVQLTWRAGREAASHQVYLGTDAGDLALLGTTTENSLDAGALNFSTTYYWSVTEVNEAETVPAHTGNIWSFTTPDYSVVDDFDQYDDKCARIFFAWEDGLGHNGGTEVDDCDVPPSNGNGGGSIVGHNQAPFAERTIVNAGSRQSLPIEYDNAFGQSEATLSLGAQDWTASGIQTLSLMFRGIAGNTGTLYVKINNTKVLYDLNPADIARAVWQAWNIDLTGMAGLQNVTELTIGIDGASAAGMLYIDDIRLYPLPGELITPAEPTTGLLAHYNLDNNTNDDSGRGHHGVVVGDARFANDPDRGGVVNFNGSDAVVQVPHSADIGFTDSTDLTLALWVKPAQLPRTSWTTIISKNRAVSPEDAYGIWISGANNWHFRVGPTSGDANLSGPPAPTEEWHLVVVTHDPDTTTLRGYLNGWLIYENTNSDPTPFTAQDALWIGGADGVSEYYPGMIDDVSIFNRPLSHEEVLWLADITQPVHKPF